MKITVGGAMRPNRVLCIFAAALGAAFTPAHAEQAKWGPMLKGFAAVGCSVQEGARGRESQILVLCDQDKVIAAVPALKAMGLLNPDISQSTINLMPGMVAASFMMEAVSSMVDPYYKSHEADLTGWEADLVVPNSYGHLRRKPVFAFRFTKSLDARVNWSNMDFPRLQKIAPGFHYFPGVQDLLNGSD